MLEKPGLGKRLPSVVKGIWASVLLFLVLAPASGGVDPSPASPLPPISAWTNSGVESASLHGKAWKIERTGGELLFLSPPLTMTGRWSHLLSLRVASPSCATLRGCIKWKKRTDLGAREDVYYSFSRKVGPGSKELLLDVGRCWYWEGAIQQLTLKLISPPPVTIESIQLCGKGFFSFLKAKGQELLSGERKLPFFFYIFAFVFLFVLLFGWGVLSLCKIKPAAFPLRTALSLVLLIAFCFQLIFAWAPVSNEVKRTGQDRLESSRLPVEAGSSLMLQDARDSHLYDFMEFCCDLLPEGEECGIFSPHRFFYYPTIRKINYYYYPALKFLPILRVIPEKLQKVNIGYEMPLEVAISLIDEKALPFTIAAVFDTDNFILLRNSFLTGEVQTAPEWEKLRSHMETRPEDVHPARPVSKKGKEGS